MDRVMLATTVDEKVANTFLRVLNVLDKPTTLQRPDVMLRVFRAARRARGQADLNAPAPVADREPA
jgi:hypothetical protein